MKKGRIYVLWLVLLSISIGMILLSPLLAKKKPTHVIKLATVAPNASFLTDLLNKEFLDPLEKHTNGNLTIDMFWGGVMGDEEDYLAKMRIDQLDGCILSVGGVLMACPEMGVLQLPFLFKDYDEVDYIRKKLYSRFDKIYENNGYKMLSWFDQDFDQIYSTKYEMRTPEDFKNSKFLTHAGEVEKILIQELGGSPIPVGVPEVVTSFRSGVCNTVISPALWWMGSQLYTITKYVNAYPFRYSPCSIVLSNKSWKKLPDKYKKVINQQIIKLGDYANKLVRNINEKCLKAMIKYGVKEVKMSPEEIEVFKERTKSLGNRLSGKLYPKELLVEIKKHLSIYRTRKGRKT